MTRTERQQEAARCWIRAKGKGSIEAATGFGKTRIGLMIIKALLKKFPHYRILVVVPTTALRAQWQKQIDEWGFSFNAESYVVNSVIKHDWNCDLLVLDECHRFNSNDFSQIFNKVKYKYILGLTATFERLDGKHYIMNKYCPIVDRVTFLEAVANGWVADYREYIVLIDVDDIETYKNYNKEWIEHFEFFNYDFDLVMNMVKPNTGWKNKLAFRDSLCRPDDDEDRRKELLRSVNFHCERFIRLMQYRKAFINNHPKKIEIAKKIIEKRFDKKIITFSNNIKMAEQIQDGKNVYSGKVSKSKSRIMIDEFNNQETGVINTIRKADEGLDIRGLSVAIILGTDSSETKARQRRGRTVRKENDKIAEVFYIIIRNTIEEKWVNNNHKTDKNYIIIDEEGLDKVLNGENPTSNRKSYLREIMFRY